MSEFKQGHVKCRDNQRVYFGTGDDASFYFDGATFRCSSTVSGVEPTQSYHLATKSYVDTLSGSISTDKIEEGNSSVEVIDTGTGEVNISLDGSVIYDFTTNQLNYTNDGMCDIWLDGNNNGGTNGTGTRLYMVNNYESTSTYNTWAANAMTSAQVRGCFQLRTRFTDTTDASRTSEVAWGVVDNGSWDVDFLTIAGHEVCIGANTPRSTLSVAGHITPVTDDTYDLGTGSYRWDDIYATNNTIQTSDERHKDNITDTDLGLDFIDSLRPISYKWKDYTATETHHTTVSGQYDENGNELYEEQEMEVEHTYHRKHYGLVAQEVETTLSGLGIDTEDFAGITYDAEADIYGLRYAEFIAPLIKAVQELKARVEALEGN